MQKTETQIWQEWAGNLRNHKLQNIVAALLDAGGPFNTIAAQLVYITQPVIKGFVSDSNITALAELLEDQEHTKRFIRSLREESI